MTGDKTESREPVFVDSRKLGVYVKRIRIHQTFEPRHFKRLVDVARVDVVHGYCH